MRDIGFWLLAGGGCFILLVVAVLDALRGLGWLAENELGE